MVKRIYQPTKHADTINVVKRICLRNHFLTKTKCQICQFKCPKIILQFRISSKVHTNPAWLGGRRCNRYIIIKRKLQIKTSYQVTNFSYRKHMHWCYHTCQPGNLKYLQIPGQHQCETVNYASLFLLIITENFSINLLITTVWTSKCISNAWQLK